MSLSSLELLQGPVSWNRLGKLLNMYGSALLCSASSHPEDLRHLTDRRPPAPSPPSPPLPLVPGYAYFIQTSSLIAHNGVRTVISNCGKPNASLWHKGKVNSGISGTFIHSSYFWSGGHASETFLLPKEADFYLSPCPLTATGLSFPLAIHGLYDIPHGGFSVRWALRFQG